MSGDKRSISEKERMRRKRQAESATGKAEFRYDDTGQKLELTRTKTGGFRVRDVSTKKV